MFEPGYLNIKNIVISGIGNHYIILVFLAIKAGKKWYSAQNENDELLQIIMETEMEIYRYQLQPKIILSLVEELEIISETDSGKMPEMIIKLSNFLNRFLFEGKEDFISLKQDVEILEEYLEIHQHALGNRFLNNFVVSGKLESFVIQPLLMIPYIDKAIKVAYKCNNSFENTVIIKAEKKYLLITFTFWSELPFGYVDDEETIMTRKRLKYGFPGKHRLIENVDENFVEISIEIYK
jgi:LytS/YehU family sensor histidine kinase